VTYVFDLDGTLCETPGSDYAKATPIEARISAVWRLKHAGHQIVIDTARGSRTGIDWVELTCEQLRVWGVPFHELRVGKKIHGDLYIDDKGVSADEFFSEA